MSLIYIASKNPLDSLSRVVAPSGNIGVGFLFTKLISDNFLKNSPFKLAGNFNPQSSAKSINNIPVKNKRTRGRVLATTTGLFKEIL